MRRTLSYLLSLGIKSLKLVLWAALSILGCILNWKGGKYMIVIYSNFWAFIFTAFTFLINATIPIYSFNLKDKCYYFLYPMMREFSKYGCVTLFFVTIKRSLKNRCFQQIVANRLGLHCSCWFWIERNKHVVITEVTKLLWIPYLNIKMKSRGIYKWVDYWCGRINKLFSQKRIRNNEQG